MIPVRKNFESIKLINLMAGDVYKTINTEPFVSFFSIPENGKAASGSHVLLFFQSTG